MIVCHFRSWGGVLSALGGLDDGRYYLLGSSACGTVVVEDDAGVDEASDEGEAAIIREISGQF